MSFITDITSAFKKNGDGLFAKQMKAYLLDHFEHYGIKTKQRRELLKETEKRHSIEVKNTIRTLTFDLYHLPQRELHLSAIELFEKHLRKAYKKEDINLIEKLITINSWWDSVDFIAKQVLGKYFLMFPDEIDMVISNFSNSDNMWLNRSTILFQLGYKENTNKELLFQQCLTHKESEEFFIQKAIGWALREYGKVNPQAVLDFVNSNTLKPLSKREAIRQLI